MRRLDTIVALVVVVFVTRGLLAGNEMARLAGFNGSLLNAASASDQVGRSRNAIALVPFVGASSGPRVAGRQVSRGSDR